LLNGEAHGIVESPSTKELHGQTKTFKFSIVWLMIVISGASLMRVVFAESELLISKLHMTQPGLFHGR